MDTNTHPQKLPKKEDQPIPSSVETTGGVSFVIPPPKLGMSEKDTTPTREEVSKVLRESGVSTVSNDEGSPSTVQNDSPQLYVTKSPLPHLRTYKDDVATALRNKKGSKVSIQAAESKRKEKRRQEDNKNLQQKKEEEERERYLQDKEERLKEKKSGAFLHEERERRANEKKIQEEYVRIREERARLAKAQRVRQEQTLEKRPAVLEEKKSGGTNVGMIVASILFLTLGSGLLYGAYALFFTEETKPPLLDITTLVFAEESKDIITDGLSGRELIETLTQEKNALSLPRGTLVNFNLTRSIPVDIALFETLPASLFLSRIAGNAPESFSRSVHAEYMLGVHVLESNEPFLILKPSFYESTFAGMLEWENRMAEDLSPLFTTALLTAPSTPPQGLLVRASEAPFEDKVIENQDTRIFYNARGEILLLYSFIDRQTLIITTNKKTFLEILNRMTAKRVSN